MKPKSHFGGFFFDIDMPTPAVKSSMFNTASGAGKQSMDYAANCARTGTCRSMSVSVERVFRSSLACMTHHDAASPPKYLANRALVRQTSKVHFCGSMPKSHLRTPLKSLAFRHRMRLNVLAQHTVHAALPAFASGFEICDNLWAVTNRNQELFFG